MKSRKDAPTKPTRREDCLCFRVWSHNPVFLEDTHPWKCTACFRFLGDCLDFIADCQDAKCDVLFQSPVDVRLFRHTDTRAVYKAA